MLISEQEQMRADNAAMRVKLATIHAELSKPGRASKKRLMAILGAGPRAKTGGVG